MNVVPARSQDVSLVPDGDHLQQVCRPGAGSQTCAYLMLSNAGFQCAKGGVAQMYIDLRLAEGTMKAIGDNCSGPPNFTPPGESDA